MTVKGAKGKAAKAGGKDGKGAGESGPQGQRAGAAGGGGGGDPDAEVLAVLEMRRRQWAMDMAWVGAGCRPRTGRG